MQDWDNAIKHYNILVTHFPEKQNFKYNLACCYEMKGEYRLAIGIMINLVMLNPKSAAMSQKLASLFMKINQPLKAKEIYEKMILMGNVSFDIYNEFAHICLMTRDIDRAEKILKKVIALKPECASAHKDLGAIYLSKRLFDYAKDEFEQALKIAPDDFGVVFEYANYLHATTDFKEADRYYALALGMKPEDGEVLAFSALNKMLMGDLEVAKIQITKAIEKSVQSGFLLFIAGNIRYLMKDYEDAKMFLVKSLELEDNNDTKNLLALCYFELGDFEQAKNIFQKLYEKSPNNLNLLLNIAKCQEKLGKKDEALKTLDKVVDVFPECEEAHEMIRALS